MVAITAIVAAIAAVLASTSVVHNVLTPRLPLYKLQTVKLFNLGMNWNALKATMTADVSLMNENYIKADVHRLRIDMYYPTWDGQDLTHIGHVVRNEEASHAEQKPNDKKENLTDKNNSVANVNSSDKKLPLWSLQPRQPFEARDDLHMTLFHMSPRTMMNLLYSIVRTGQLVIPSTGVAHVKATGAGAQMTIAMICDNHVEVWSQNVVGRDCTMNKLSTGWINMDKEHARLQKDAYQRHFGSSVEMQHETGVVMA